MILRPRHKNVPQAVLHHVGANYLGIDSANVLADTDVRRAGAGHILRKTGALALAAGATIGVLKVAEYGVQHSPMVTYDQRNGGTNNTTTHDIPLEGSHPQSDSKQ